MAAVSAGITQSASGTYSEDDSSQDDATDMDQDSGSFSSTSYAGYTVGDALASTTGDTNDASSLDSTSKSLGSSSETASLTQALDAGPPSIFTRVCSSLAAAAFTPTARGPRGPRRRSGGSRGRRSGR